MIKIHKEVYGQGKPIVLIHGWAMHTGVWRKFAQQLALDYQVICLDLPGHGRSETVDPYTLDQISSVMMEVLPESPCTVLGWSLGTAVALFMAKHYPQRVNSLILLAANPRFVQDDDWAGMPPKLLEDFGCNLHLDFQLTLVRFLALQVNGLANGKAILNELKKVLRECDSPSETVLQSGLDILEYEDLRDDLTSLSCPVNIIQGDKDALVPVEVGPAMHRIQPAAEVNVITGAGHVPFLSHQTEVIQIIKRFI